MPELSFAVEGAQAEPYAAAPLLLFKLRIRQAAEGAAPIHAVVLRCQIRIEPAKRRYEGAEGRRLLDLFDTPERWGQTMRSMLWTHTSAVVPPFTDSVVVDLPLPCTFDFNVAATKYFYALEQGEVPLNLLFSGTIFMEVEEVGLQVAQIPWDREAAYRLPVAVWKEMMERYYPNSAWLNLRRDVFDRLYQFKSEQRLPTWEQALEQLLARGWAVNQKLVERIANAVLYEGYILYPYRPSVKNRQRWTFGGLYPRAYSEAQGGSDAWFTQTECLVTGDGRTTLDVVVRFLHLVNRQVGELEHPRAELPDDQVFRLVDRLEVGDRLLQSWQEAVEREHRLPPLEMRSLSAGPVRHEFSFGGSRSVEAVRDSSGAVAAVLVREQQPVAGAVEVSAEAAGAGVFKVRVRIENCAPFAGAERSGRDEALLRALASTHSVLGARAGGFVSLIDPPGEWAALAAACQNVGAWPVLVGEAGDRDTLLSAPIILYDYPQIAPESPGDLFDGTEIDEILTLRILTLTDEEKKAAAAVDERARALLQRTEGLAGEQLMGLHGTFRRPPAEERHD